MFDALVERGELVRREPVKAETVELLGTEGAREFAGPGPRGGQYGDEDDGAENFDVAS